MSNKHGFVIKNSNDYVGTWMKFDFVDIQVLLDITLYMLNNTTMYHNQLNTSSKSTVDS